MSLHAPRTVRSDWRTNRGVDAGYDVLDGLGTRSLRSRHCTSTSDLDGSPTTTRTWTLSALPTRGEYPVTEQDVGPGSSLGAPPDTRRHLRYVLQPPVVTQD